MVEKEDVTNSELEKKEMDKKVRGLIKRVLGEEITFAENSGVFINVRDLNRNRIARVDRQRHTVTVYNPKYEVMVEKIAIAYEKMIQKEVTLRIDYSEARS